MQQIIVIAIVLVALGLLAKRVIRIIKGQGKPCSSCSSGCICHRFCDSNLEKQEKNNISTQKNE